VVTNPTRVARVEHLLLQLEHELAVLRVHRGDGAQLVAAREGVHQRLVVAHDGVLVRRKVAAGHVVAFEASTFDETRISHFRVLKASRFQRETEPAAFKLWLNWLVQQVAFERQTLKPVFSLDRL
jgi:hypothetical protein